MSWTIKAQHGKEKHDITVPSNGTMIELFEAIEISTGANPQPPSDPQCTVSDATASRLLTTAPRLARTNYMRAMRTHLVFPSGSRCTAVESEGAETLCPRRNPLELATKVLLVLDHRQGRHTW